MAGDVAGGVDASVADTTATFTVTFAAKACMPVVPVDAGCGPGDVCQRVWWQPPTVTLPSTAGIVYSDRAGDLGDGTADVDGDGDGDGARRVMVGGSCRRVGAGRCGDGDVDGDVVGDVV